MNSPFRNPDLLILSSMILISSSVNLALSSVFLFNFFLVFLGGRVVGGGIFLISFSEKIGVDFFGTVEESIIDWDGISER